MKRLIAILPVHFDWSSAVKDGLVFGITASVAIHLLPPISRAVLAAIGRAGASPDLPQGLDQVSPTP
jgi:hypothetical protein